MLERCAAQGLIERDANRRPREYTITPAGRHRLAGIVRSEADSELESTDKETKAILRNGSRKVRDLLERVRKLQAIEAECEGMSESAKQAKAEAHSEVMRNLYRALYELRSLGFFDSKNDVRARIAELELDSGKEISERLERLVSLEVRIRNESGADLLRTVLELRESLQFPVSVFGLPPEN
jgi:DNA-binding PadR family transcriptional regulator